MEKNPDPVSTLYWWATSQEAEDPACFQKAPWVPKVGSELSLPSKRGEPWACTSQPQMHTESPGEMLISAPVGGSGGSPGVCIFNVLLSNADAPSLGARGQGSSMTTLRHLLSQGWRICQDQRCWLQGAGSCVRCESQCLALWVRAWIIASFIVLLVTAAGSVGDRPGCVDYCHWFVLDIGKASDSSTLSSLLPLAGTFWALGLISKFSKCKCGKSQLMSWKKTLPMCIFL